MGRRDRGQKGPPPEWEGERTLAAAEAEAREKKQGGEAAPSRCPCGSTELLAAAFLLVRDGVPEPRPVELETLTCPECGREFDAIEGEGGRILRGDFLGYFADDDG